MVAEKLRTRTNIAANSLKTTAPPSARGAPRSVGAGQWCGRRDGCCGAATVADDEARTDGARGKGRPVAQGCRPNGAGQSQMTVGDKKHVCRWLVASANVMVIVSVAGSGTPERASARLKMVGSGRDAVYPRMTRR